MEPAMGTPSQARAYCTKVDTRVEAPKEFGDLPREIASNPKVHPLQEALKAGASDAEMWEEHFGLMLRSYRGISAYRSATTPARDTSKTPRIYLFTGDPGCGKSTWCKSTFPGAYWVARPRKGGDLWWNNYNGEDTVIFDDFYGWCPYDLLLRLCDSTQLMVEQKGGMVQFRATSIVFTSNKHYSDWYSGDIDLGGWKRRLYEFGWNMVTDAHGSVRGELPQITDRLPTWTRRQGDDWISDLMARGDGGRRVADGGGDGADPSGVVERAVRMDSGRRGSPSQSQHDSSELLDELSQLSLDM